MIFSYTHPLKSPRRGRNDSEEQQGKLPARKSSKSNKRSLQWITTPLTEFNLIRSELNLIWETKSIGQNSYGLTVPFRLDTPVGIQENDELSSFPPLIPFVANVWWVCHFHPFIRLPNEKLHSGQTHVITLSIIHISLYLYSIVISKDNGARSCPSASLRSCSLILSWWGKRHSSLSRLSL